MVNAELIKQVKVQIFFQSNPNEEVTQPGELKKGNTIQRIPTFVNQVAEANIDMQNCTVTNLFNIFVKNNEKRQFE